MAKTKASEQARKKTLKSRMKTKVLANQEEVVRQRIRKRRSEESRKIDGMDDREIETSEALRGTIKHKSGHTTALPQEIRDMIAKYVPEPSILELQPIKRSHWGKARR